MAFRNRVLIVRVAARTIVNTSIFFIIAFFAFFPLSLPLVKAFLGPNIVLLWVFSCRFFIVVIMCEMTRLKINLICESQNRIGSLN